MTIVYDDYDTPWKNIIETYFEELMAFFFPAAHADIDWSRPVEFLDKELQQVVRDAEFGRRYVDKLAKVWRKDGAEQWVLAHLEVQGQYEAAFDERMYTYNYRLFDRYKRQVASFAVLSDSDPDWKPGKYESQLWGCNITFTFPVAKLTDYKGQWAVLEASNNPFARRNMTRRSDASGSSILSFTGMSKGTGGRILSTCFTSSIGSCGCRQRLNKNSGRRWHNWR